MSQANVSRRDFVKGLAIAGAMTAAAGTLAGCKKETASSLPQKWDEKVDVLIVGSGAAGLSAAVMAKDAGADVLVLEKMSFMGGNTAISTAGMNAAGTEVQKANGIEDDSPDIFFQDIMAGGDYKNYPELVRILADNADDAVAWLQELGAPFPGVGWAGGASRQRAHTVTPSYGQGIIELLAKVARDKGVEIRTEAEAKNLFVEPDTNRVVGLEVSDKGNEITIQANRAVILTTGGFGANPDLIVRYDPSLKGFSTTNMKGATGECMQMARDVAHADVAGINYIQIHPTVHAFDGKQLMITEGVRGAGAILVNQGGQRFIEELERRDVVSAAEMQQEGKYAYLILAQNIAHSKIKVYKEQDMVIEADTIEDLASKIGIDPAALKKTVDTYNSYVENGEDLDFARRNMAGKIEEPPFYAIKVTPGVHHCMGGLRINTQTQVIDVWDQVIPGLYAAGEVTGGIHGSNRLGGTAIADCITFGRIAGQNAAGETPAA